MDNAAQALVIAGAVLLAILVIALGMLIFNRSRDNLEASIGEMSSHEKTVFNNKFENYKGKIKGTQVQSLVNVVRTNAAENVNYPGRLPTIEVGEAPATGEDDVDSFYANGSVSNITPNAFYDISFSYNSSGLVNGVYIQGEGGASTVTINKGGNTTGKH